jgi:hypothetical protein
MSVKRSWNCNTLKGFKTITLDGEIFIDHEDHRTFIRHKKFTTTLDSKTGIFTDSPFRMKVGDRLFGKCRVHEGELGSGVELFIMVSKTPDIDYHSKAELYVIGGQGWSQASDQCVTDQIVPFVKDVWWDWMFQAQPDTTLKGLVKVETDLNFIQVMHTLPGWTDVPLYWATQPVSGWPVVGNDFDIDQVFLTNMEGR